MKLTNLNQALILILAFVGIIFSTSCKQMSTSIRPDFKSDSLVAHFDYFTYTGNDDFYNENPLPGDDYYYNPIIPGWYSDPSICTNGEDYFLVTSTFSYFPGVPIFHSTDLMNWKQIGNVLNRPEQLPLEGQGISRGIFAPAISYNPHNKTYYMITTNMLGGNFLVKTTDPFGDWSDPIWLPEVHGIDPSLFFDDDGKAYIVNNDEPDGGSTYQGHRAIRGIEYDLETDKTVGKSIMLVNGGVDLSEKPIWIEGPHMYKINGSYYLMCAEGGTSVNHREVIFKSTKPFGKYTPWDENPMLTQKHLSPERELPITCAGHADIIQKDNGEWWSVFLACRPIDNKFENLGRETFMMPVRWGKDGYPYMTKGDEVVPRIIRMEGVKRDSSITFGNFTKNDEFDAATLGMEWLTVRGNAAGLYSLAENPGYLNLKCADVAANELKVPAFIGRRLQHHKFESTSAMYYSPNSETESAGMLIMKNEQHQYLMVVEKIDGQTAISVKKVGATTLDVVSSETIILHDEQIRLKIASNGYEFSFYYALGDDDWKLIADKVDASFLSTARAGGFTGTTIGMYASAKEFSFE
ncbi:glycoside hydrolase family 43 protein [uncultured Draconibacterium sp.]|uniref:glycoside hydrolase family 43 protein n=1 Tax=uncultured Draconibacterium sp. TaxID=1573823 RepID=UPI0025D1B771|nr:glycoside hydrolase family 43 protein [uncultured Draconibacterium sp.]